MKKILLVISAFLLGIGVQASGPKPDLKYGPWVHNVTETGFTVLWTSEQETFAWVEIAPDDGSAFEAMTRQRHYQTVAGKRVSGKLHRVEVKGLEPGKSYRYRVYGQTVIDDSHPSYIQYGHTRRVKFKFREEAVIRTLDHNAESCKFIMLNDIHGKDDKYKALAGDVDPKSLDLLVLNGDMMSNVVVADSMLKHVVNVLPTLMGNVPTVYTRGNHETRGRDAHRFQEFFPTPTGEPYYMLRQGPVAFLFMCAGEDKPDASVEYGGTADYDTYRQVELEWLKEAVKDPVFVEAPVKVAVMHIPAVNLQDSWYSQIWAHDVLVPILNEAGVDVMLSGHHHKHIYAAPGEFLNQFPIIVNDDTDRLEFEATSKGYRIRTVSMEGVQTHSYEKKL